MKQDTAKTMDIVAKTIASLPEYEQTYLMGYVEGVVAMSEIKHHLSEKGNSAMERRLVQDEARPSA